MKYCPNKKMDANKLLLLVLLALVFVMQVASSGISETTESTESKESKESTETDHSNGLPKPKNHRDCLKIKRSDELAIADVRLKCKNCCHEFNMLWKLGPTDGTCRCHLNRNSIRPPYHAKGIAPLSNKTSETAQT